MHLAALALLFALPGAALPAGSPICADSCAPGVRQRPDSEDPVGYHLRGDRCEGRYEEPLAAETLRAVGLTEGAVEEALASGAVLDLAWPATPHGGATALTATALEPRTYYRMDTCLASGTQTYRWPSGMVSSLGLEVGEVAVAAKTEWPVEGRDREVLLPVRVGRGGPAPRASTYTLWLLPGEELREIWVRIDSAADVAADRQQTTTALQASFYPAGYRVKVPVPKPETAGLYRVRLTFETTAGDPGGREVWLYHDGS